MRRAPAPPDDHDDADDDDAGSAPAGSASGGPPPLLTAPVRIDKWLWAARCFKTRSQATAACTGGHVSLNGAVARPAAKVKVGDRVEGRTPGGLRVLAVLGLADRRGPAAFARTLFADHSPPPPPRVGPAFARDRGAGRPTKADRRALDRLRGDDGFDDGDGGSPSDGGWWWDD